MYTGTLINDLINAVESTEKRIPGGTPSQEDKLAYWYSISQRELSHIDLNLSGVA
jgi:hypothetical protein